MSSTKIFSNNLLDWYDPKDRSLPWKGEKDPYKIWVSEIILQQTRAEQAIPYYKNFISQFPTVKELASSSEDKVLKYWEGLGYYSRARNLHFAAKQVVQKMDGQIPDSYDKLINLKGIGPYTAAAIASFAFDLPHPVLDGNVYRVLSRYFNIDSPINESRSKKVFVERLNKVFVKNKAALFNQSIMDFGATICKPKKPLCNTCPMKKNCQALKYKTVFELPKKSKKIVKRDRAFHYLLLQNKDDFIIQRREANDIWKGLYQLPLYESNSAVHQEVISQFLSENTSSTSASPTLIDQRKSILTHQKITAYFWHVNFRKKEHIYLAACKWINKKDLTKFAFPKMFDLFFKQNSLI